jgi:DNA-binding transcriptional MerR regulator
MERNRWETAIRCLEVALHPNTSDEEVLAGVNGFRRTAAGLPLSEVCAALADQSGDAGLGRENLDLRRRLDRERADQLAALRRLQEAERLIHELSAEIRAEQQSFAEFRSASADIVEGLKDENVDLRGALDEARRAVERPAGRRPSSFRDVLNAALNPGQARAAPPMFDPPPRHPWTA